MFTAVSKERMTSKCGCDRVVLSREASDLAGTTDDYINKN